MATINISSPQWEVEIDSLGYVTDKHTLIGEFLNRLLKWNNAIELKKFEFEKQEDGDYLYKVTAIDDKKWKQTIKLLPNNKSSMDFNINDFWQVDEFAPHRDVRNTAITMAHMLGITKIKVIFEI